MSWTWKQASGCLLSAAGKIVLTGYSGHGTGVNNPAMQGIPMVGPVPAGRYRMVSIGDYPQGTGAASIILEPDPTNEMHGRAGFRIHGDNAAQNRSASEGCIVVGHSADRHAIWDSGDHDLIVEP